MLKLRDCNWTRTHNHLVWKWTLNHLAKLAKWLNWVVSTYLYIAFDCMFCMYICSHLNFKFHECFEQGLSWHSGNYRAWIHSEMRTWHDKNIQLKLSLCNYCDVCLLVKGTVTNPNKKAAAAPDPNNRSKKVVFKNCAPLYCVREIYNT